MRRSGRIIMLLGLVLGAVTAGLLLYFLTSAQPGGTETKLPTTKIVVAEQPITPRSTIQQGTVNLKDWPTDFLPPGVVSDPNLVIGRLATTRIEPGQAIVSSMIISRPATTSAPSSDATYLIPRNRVAVAFPINSVLAVAGAIREGDLVDIMASYPLASPAATTAQNAPAQSTIRVVSQYTLQNVEIFRIGTWPATGQTGARQEGQQDVAIVTVLLDRQDALVLKFLRETSTELQFALRPAGDRAEVRVEPVIIEYIDQRFNFNGLLGRSR